MNIENNGENFQYLSIYYLCCKKTGIDNERIVQKIAEELRDNKDS